MTGARFDKGLLSAASGIFRENMHNFFLILLMLFPGGCQDYRLNRVNDFRDSVIVSAGVGAGIAGYFAVCDKVGGGVGLGARQYCVGNFGRDSEFYSETISIPYLPLGLICSDPLVIFHALLFLQEEEFRQPFGAARIRGNAQGTFTSKIFFPNVRPQGAVTSIPVFGKAVTLVPLETGGHIAETQNKAVADELQSMGGYLIEIKPAAKAESGNRYERRTIALIIPKYANKSTVDFNPFGLDAGVFLGVVGTRIGFSPVEFIDFILGFTTLDFMGDDLAEEERRRNAQQVETKSSG